MPRNVDDDAFARSRARFEEVVGLPASPTPGVPHTSPYRPAVYR